MNLWLDGFLGLASAASTVMLMLLTRLLPLEVCGAFFAARIRSLINSLFLLTSTVTFQLRLILTLTSFQNHTGEQSNVRAPVPELGIGDEAASCVGCTGNGACAV